MNPCSHGEFSDEDIASFREENRSLSADHFDFRIGFHHLLDASKRKLVDFEIMLFSFEMIYGLLPVCCKDVSRWACQALIDLGPLVFGLGGMGIRADLTFDHKPP